MSKSKYTVIGHQHLLLCNPVSSEKVNEVIGLLQFPSDTIDFPITSIDFGAGKAELSFRLIEQLQSDATAVEFDSEFIKEAQSIAVSRNIPENLLHLELADAKAFYENCKDSGRLFDITICIGSIHIFGGYINTVEALLSITKPNGYILLGDLYWRKPDNINQDFLDFLQMPKERLLSHQDHIHHILKQENPNNNTSLQLICDYETTPEEFEIYETSLAASREEYVQQHPDDEENEIILTRNRNWLNAFHKWGKEEFGFGLYLFQKIIR